jgi:general secretion pathway protein A
VFESHFGLSAPPFQLNPDPTFYFGSKGHSNALAYLQYGVHQAEGFIVVTGEIGAGKTTLVRTLLEGLDAGQVRAAQIASTQLDATGLLQAMLTAFGVPPPAGPVSKPALISTLEAFFMTLAMKNKRALLVVDEAQNLSMDAIEELRMLSNFQLRKQALLQSFLVGQPELRSMLESQRLEQLRQRVIASCHLGPLDQDETRQYIEHRLNRVGWSGTPSFDGEAAFKRIHLATGGIPRRINLLCNRLFLSAFLEGLSHLSEDHVRRIAHELRDEVGETTVAILPRKAAKVTVPQALPVPVSGPESNQLVYQQMAPPVVQSVQGALHELAHPMSRIVREERTEFEATIFCLVDSHASYMKAALLATAFERIEGRYRVVVVACKSPEHLGLMDNYAEAVNLPSMEVHLGAVAGSMARCIADSVLRFESLVQEFAPQAVLALGLSDEVVACSLQAVRANIALVRPDAGRLEPDVLGARRLNAQLLDRAAHLLYTDSTASSVALFNQGIAADRVQVLGSLMHDGVVAARASDPISDSLMAHHGLQDGFVMVTSRVGPGRLSATLLGSVLSMLSRVRGERHMLWLVCGETQSALRSQGLGSALSRSGIALASTPLFSARLGLLQRAAFLVTDSVDELVEMALPLGKKVLLVHGPDQAKPAGTDPAIASLGLDATELGEALPAKEMQFQPGGTAPDLVDHLTQWLADQNPQPTGTNGRDAK